jgi:hypothetical protein
MWYWRPIVVKMIIIKMMVVLLEGTVPWYVDDAVDHER